MVARVEITCLDGVTLQVVALYFLRTKCRNDFALNSCIIMSWGYLSEKPAKWSTSFLQSVKSCSHPIFSICLGLCILALTPYKFQPWTRDLRFVYFRTFCQPRFAAVKHLDKLKRLINFAAIFQKKKKQTERSLPTKKATVYVEWLKLQRSECSISKRCVLSLDAKISAFLLVCVTSTFSRLYIIK